MFLRKDKKPAPRFPGQVKSRHLEFLIHIMLLGSAVMRSRRSVGFAHDRILYFLALQSCLLAFFLGSYPRYPFCGHASSHFSLVHIPVIHFAVMLPRIFPWFISQISIMQSCFLAFFLGPYLSYPLCSHASSHFSLVHISVIHYAVIRSRRGAALPMTASCFFSPAVI